jgi:hypothetical protein
MKIDAISFHDLSMVSDGLSTPVIWKESESRH